MMAMEEVKLMPLSEVGLLVKMRWAAWSNDTLPADPPLLARVLGLTEEEVRANLSLSVLSFFAPAKGYSERLECPELVGQMERLRARAEERADAGRRGGKSTQRGRKHLEAQVEAQLKPQLKRAEKSRSEKNRGESSP